ncbi:MAG: glycosyltransferase family 4 protein, partial [Verrucomicrobiota bacterium]|nr:glycosyltransferase family 4 protein [Verrucomicrobiota bacterium]
MKLAVVIPWFGRELKGGAEQQAWQIAARLAARGHEIEVVTTCCRSHQDDWSTNHLKAGSTDEPEGFKIRRFPVVERNRAAFDRVCSYLLSLKPNELMTGMSPVVTEDAATFTDELIKSPELLLFLSDHHWDFDWVLFLPYLYGPILHGVSIVGERAALQPCLHDEAYAYLPQVAEAFYRCGKLLFNSDGERELASRLFGPAIWQKSAVVGEGVETAGHDGLAVNGAASPRSEHSYVLYLGRRDAGKNVPLLVNAFRRFKKARPNSKLRLILAGNGDVDVQGQRDIDDLGLVSEEVKERLLSDCAALFQPSANESFSRVMMEAWMHGRPVAAHAACLATAVAVDRSRGGWVAGSEDEWAALFAEVARTPARQLAQRGERGRTYARDLADWDRVMERYEH